MPISGSIMNGMISYLPMTTPYLFGSAAQYTCNDGFYIQGNDVRTCASDGSSSTGVWSDTSQSAPVSRTFSTSDSWIYFGFLFMYESSIAFLATLVLQTLRVLMFVIFAICSKTANISSWVNYNEYH